jgi:hypothetical protein
MIWHAGAIATTPPTSIEHLQSMGYIKLVTSNIHIISPGFAKTSAPCGFFADKQQKKHL